MPPKNNYPALGNSQPEGTFLPVNVGPLSTAYVRKLKEQGKWEDFLAYRKRLLDLFEIKNLSELQDRLKDKRMMKKIRDAMANDPTFAGLDTDIEKRIERMEGFGDDANELISAVIGRYFHGHRYDLDMKNEVRHCNDPAKLLLMTQDNRLDTRMRFEAKRKLLLMEIFAKRKMALRKFRDHLDKFYELLGDRVLEGNPGYMEEHYLIATLDEDQDNACVREGEGQPMLMNQQPALIEKNQICIPMGMRSILGVDEQGKGRKVDFYIDSRRKGSISQVLKMIRKDTIDPEEWVKDLNGVRMVFKDETEEKIFKDTFNKKLKKEGYEVQMEEPEETIGHAEKIKEKRDVGGGRKSRLLISKGKLKKQEMKIELQTFTFPEFVDYEFKVPNAWIMYDITRFFEAGLGEVLFPKDFYSSVNQDRVYLDTILSIYEEHLKEYKSTVRSPGQMEGDLMKALKKYQEFLQQELEKQALARELDERQGSLFENPVPGKTPSKSEKDRSGSDS